jgi:hypothetical protein
MRHIVVFVCWAIAFATVPILAQAQPRFQCQDLACPEGGMAFGPYPFCSCQRRLLHASLAWAPNMSALPCRATPSLLPNFPANALAPAKEIRIGAALPSLPSFARRSVPRDQPRSKAVLPASVGVVSKRLRRSALRSAAPLAGFRLRNTGRTRRGTVCA